MFCQLFYVVQNILVLDHNILVPGPLYLNVLEGLYLAPDSLLFLFIVCLIPLARANHSFFVASTIHFSILQIK